jgi:hypothetical protein
MGGTVRIVGDRRIRTILVMNSEPDSAAASLARTWQACCARAFFFITVECATSRHNEPRKRRRSPVADGRCRVRSGGCADETAATSGGHLRGGCRLVLMHTHFTPPIFPPLTTASTVVDFCMTGSAEPAHVQSVASTHILALLSWYKPADGNQSVHSR